MDALRDRLARALQGVGRVAAPGPPGASGAVVGEDLVSAFAAALARAAGTFARMHDLAAARAWLEARAAGGGLVHAGEAVDGEAFEARLRAAAVGVDEADLLIAETGTVVRTFPSRAAARVTLVPPVAVFVATPGALVRDLPEALARLASAHRAGRASSAFVTGPSRTADIEKQLVIPAHGPRELVVLLVERP